MSSSPSDSLPALPAEPHALTSPAAADGFEIRQRGWMKRLLPQTTFGRSLLLIVIPLVLVQMIAAWIFYDRHWETVSYRLSADVAGDIAMVIDAVDPTPSDPALSAQLRHASGMTELDFTFRSGALLPEAGPASGTTLEKQLSRALTRRVQRPFRIDDVSCERCVLVDVQLDTGVLTANIPRGRLFTATTYIFILWMVGSSLVLLAIATVFLRNQVKSLRRLAAAAEEFGKGRPVSFTKPEGALEVRQAGAAFLRMRERIDRQIRQRTEMLAGVSHDLRTPLTRMKLALALLGEDSAVTELKSDVAEMERLVNLYLDFARGEGTETIVETDIALLIEDVAAAAERQGAALTLARIDELFLPVRPNALRRCLSNLIANARHYGRHVWVSVLQVEDGIDILIDDDGPGIPAAERERVFQPFVRLDTSRNPSTGGVGLGLTIARDVARSHGGDVRLETSPHGGLRARVHLPR
ncbi:MAG TPA: ATP-binding protein [Stellaceae bacterium]|jgi:two-component system osmolarity sensor histidine kinase EnvZ